MNIHDLMETVEWSQPIQLNTKRGVRLLKKAPIEQAFWKVYGEDKELFKKQMGDAGIQLGKFRDEWQLTWWSTDDLKFKQIIGNDTQAEAVQELELIPLLHPEGLLEYQLTSVQMGVASMNKYNRALLGHSTGVGKTFCALGIARELGKRVAVICPKPITTDWHRAAKMMGVEVFEICGWEWTKTGKSQMGRWTDEKKKEFRFMLPADVMLIMDECHRCFPYSTMVETDKGRMRIGDIVEKRIDAKILSCNLSSNEREYKPITNRFKFDSGKLVLVKHERGEFICTDDHKLWCEDRKEFIEAIGSKGIKLQVLRKRNNSLLGKEVLFSKMLPKKQEIKISIHNQMRLLQGGYVNNRCKKKPQILRSEVCGISETSKSRISQEILGDILFAGMQERKIGKNDSAYARSKFKVETSSCEANEREQSHVKFTNTGKGYGKIERKDISFEGWKWEDNYSTRNTCKSIGVGDGNSNSYLECSIFKSSKMLQGGYWKQGFEDCNRSGWRISQNQKMEIFGQEKNRDIEFSRVVSVEVLEQGDKRRLKSLCGKGESVYCLEVEGNHNFYADGVLVSNCKGEGTQNAFLLRDSVVQNIPAIALSATIADDPTKLWALGQFLGLHQGGKDYFRFLSQNGCRKTRFGMQFTGGHSVLKKLHSRIYPERGNRLRHSDLGDAFPETLIKAKAFDMDNAKKIAGEYDDLCNRIEELRGLENFSANVLAEQTRARQRIELHKAPAVCAMVRDMIEEGNSVFVAVNYTETRKFILDELKTTCSIHGGQDEMERRGNIDAFQRDDSRVIVGIIQACREGLNLHDLNGNHPRVALIMPSPSVFDLKQVLGRVHRSGGKSKSLQYIVYAAGVGIEESICEKLDTKLKRLDVLADGEVDPTISLAPKEVA